MRVARLNMPGRKNGRRLRSSIPKGLRLKAQGCEPRATLGKGSEELPTPTGLWISERRFPRVARSFAFAWLRRDESRPWAGGHNPFGIEIQRRALCGLSIAITIRLHTVNKV